MALLITYTDQQTIKPISPNFPEQRFKQMVYEVQVNDLQKLLGFDFYQDIIQNPATTWNAALLNGGTYTYNSVTYIYSGLKYVLAYFLYAQYIKHSSTKDTFGGFVHKQFEDSREINKGEQSNIHNDFRKIAFKYWDECVCFIKANSENFPYFYTDPPPRSCYHPDGSNKTWCF